MPIAATIADVKLISQREAAAAGRKIIGIVISEPRYDWVPAEGVDGAVLEFLADVQILEGASQQVVPGATGDGLSVVRNLIIAHEAVGDLLTDAMIPVEIERSSSGQLTIVGRSKVRLPSLRLDTYSLKDLGMMHLSGLTLVNGQWQDPFGRPAGADQRSFGAGTRIQSETTYRLSTLGELSQNVEAGGNVPPSVPLETYTFQRFIPVRDRRLNVTAEETITITESYTVELS